MARQIVSLSLRFLYPYIKIELKFCLQISFQDMSENFPGTLMMLSCTFSSIFSGFMPYIFGVVLGENMVSFFRNREKRA